MTVPGSTAPRAPVPAETEAPLPGDTDVLPFPPRTHGLGAPQRSFFDSAFPMLLQGSAVAAAILAASGCVTVTSASLHDNAGVRLARSTLFPPLAIDEDQEAGLLRAAHQSGTIVELSPGLPGAATLLTIHGINAAPNTVEPLNVRGIQQGERVLTFAYDDRYSRLTDTSGALAQELSTWMKEHPGQPLAIQAHSMGGRIVLGSLHQLHTRGELSSPIDLTLLAPPLAGYGSANGARMLPDFLARVFGGAMPGKDMGTNSDYQHMLETLELPSSVKIRIYLAADDTIAKPDSPTNVLIAPRLGARLFRVEGAHHTSVVNRVVSPDPKGIIDITPTP